MRLLDELGGPRDSPILEFQSVERNLNALRGNRGRLQIAPQLPDFFQQGSQILRICRGVLTEDRCGRRYNAEQKNQPTHSCLLARECTPCTPFWAQIVGKQSLN